MADETPCDAPRTDRGEIVEMHLKIQYPDGSTKEVSYDEDWLFEAGAILFAESCMTPDQREQFHESDDWRKNPTFIKWERGHKRCGAACVGGGTCTNCCYCESC